MKEQMQELIDLLRKSQKKSEAQPAAEPRFLVWFFAVIGAVATVCAFAYGLYRLFMPNYLEDFKDEDYADNFDDYFEDEEGEAEQKKEEGSAE